MEKIDITQDILNYAKEQRDKGLSFQKIANKVNECYALAVSKGTVSNWEKRWGWTLPESQAPKVGSNGTAYTRKKREEQHAGQSEPQAPALPVMTERGGNPDSLTKYDPAYHPRALTQLIIEGKNIAEICDIFEISYSTYYEWIAQHPELQKAIDVGQNVQLSQVQQAMVKAATGFAVDAVKIFMPKDAPIGDDGIPKAVYAEYRQYFKPDVKAIKLCHELIGGNDDNIAAELKEYIKALAGFRLPESAEGGAGE